MEDSIDIPSSKPSPPEVSSKQPRKNQVTFSKYPKRDRQPTPSDWFIANKSTSNLSYALLANDEPVTYQEAINSSDSQQWQEAMQEEHNSLLDNNTWELVDRPPKTKPLTGKWIFKKKYHSDGSIERYKARYVIKGYLQKHGIDYEETFAPVAKYDSVRTILSLAATMEILQFDIKTAFLYGDLEETIYMEQPEGFVSSDKVCQLKKSLYGLKQAPRCWNKKFNNFLTEYGFTPSTADNCVYISTDKNVTTYLVIYVDDGLCCSTSSSKLEEIKSILTQNFECRFSQPENFIGLHITRDNNSLSIDQHNYTKKIINKFNMQDSKPLSTPADPHSTLSSTPTSESEEPFKPPFSYREAIGSLMFLMVGTRPDIAFAVSTAAKFCENPLPSHFNAVKRIFRYLNGTQHYKLSFSGSNDSFSFNELTGYCDADYAGDLDSRRSTNGYVFLLNNGPIAWCSQRQKSVSTSTTEAEYVSASHATKECIWLRKLLSELQLTQQNPSFLFCDNQSAIKLVHNPEFHKRTKHIDVQYHFIREKQQDHTIDIQYIDTDNQVADIFTKALPADRFKRLCSMLLQHA